MANAGTPLRNSSAGPMLWSFDQEQRFKDSGVGIGHEVVEASPEQADGIVCFVYAARAISLSA